MHRSRLHLQGIAIAAMGRSYREPQYPPRRSGRAWPRKSGSPELHASFAPPRVLAAGTGSCSARRISGELPVARVMLISLFRHASHLCNFFTFYIQPDSTSGLVAAMGCSYRHRLRGGNGGPSSLFRGIQRFSQLSTLMKIILA